MDTRINHEKDLKTSIEYFNSFELDKEIKDKCISFLQKHPSNAPQINAAIGILHDITRKVVAKLKFEHVQTLTFILGKWSKRVIVNENICKLLVSFLKKIIKTNSAQNSDVITQFLEELKKLDVSSCNSEIELMKSIQEYWARLHRAIENLDFKQFKLLIAENVNVNLKIEGLTPLRSATLQILLLQQWSSCAEKHTANLIKMIKVLIDKKATVCFDVLEDVIKTNIIELVELFLSRVDKSTFPKTWQEDLAFNACSRENSIAVLSVLQKEGIDLNIINNDGNNLLNRVLEKMTHSYAELDYLLSQNVNPNHLNDKLNPLQNMLRYNPNLILIELNTANEYPANFFEDIISKLKNAGMDLNQQNDLNQTALHMAIEEGYQKAAIALIVLGADINQTDNFSQTPLHYAAAKGLPIIVEKLLAMGAKPDVVDKHGLTPLQLSNQKFKEQKKQIKFFSKKEYDEFEARHQKIQELLRNASNYFENDRKQETNSTVIILRNNGSPLHQSKKDASSNECIRTNDSPSNFKFP